MNSEITFDFFIKTALALWERPENKDLGEDELFDAAWAFLKRARDRHRAYLRGRRALWVDAPRLPLAQAIRITGEQTVEKAVPALVKFVRPEKLELFKKYGVNEEFCDYLHKEYQRWRKAAVREAQSKAGKEKAQYLKRGEESSESKAPKRAI